MVLYPEKLTFGWTSFRGAAALSDLAHRQQARYSYHARMTQKRKASKTSKKLFVGSGKKLTQESVKSLHKLQGSRTQPKGGSLARSGKRYDKTARLWAKS